MAEKRKSLIFKIQEMRIEDCQAVFVCEVNTKTPDMSFSSVDAAKRYLRGIGAQLAGACWVWIPRTAIGRSIVK